MRPVAFVTRAFAGCRAKMFAMCEQMFGPDSVDVYRMASAPSDIEFLGTDVDHTYEKSPDEVIDEVLKHEYIHGFCDQSALLKPLVDADVPFIAHQHDVFGMREADYFEPFLHMAPKAVSVFTSQAHRDYVFGRWNLPFGDSHLIFNLPVMAWQPEIPKPRVKIDRSLVYFGGVNTDPSANTGYRFYLPQWRRLVEAGVKVHIYTHGQLSRGLYSTYRSHPLMFIHQRIPHHRLYEEISQYTVGFNGYNNIGGVPKAWCDFAPTCVPNKAFDYMFAGIPTLSYNLGESLKYALPWTVPRDHVDQLVDGFEKATTLKIDYEKHRKEWCMETQLPAIKDIYAQVRRKL